MLIKILPVVFLAAAQLYAQTFALNPVQVREAAGRLYVSTKGTPPAAADLQDAAHWMVTGQAPDAKQPEAITLAGNPIWDAGSATITLNYTVPADLGQSDPRAWTWKVTYTPSAISTTSTAKTPHASQSFFGAAKGKSDADIYLSGTFLAGQGTKPLYTLDAKIGWVPEWRSSLSGSAHPRTSIFAGVESSLTINSTASPPVNRTQTDPDSITADINVHFIRSNWIFALYPLKGEFSRRNADSNLVPAGTIQWAWAPKNIGKRSAIAFYPSIGIEGGRNLDKPATFDGAAANLSGYNGIFRGVIGAFAAYYFESAKADPDNPYQFEITSTFVDRIVATPEPFLTTSLVNGKSVTKVNFSTNPREYIETDLTWNINSLVGVTVKDTWGSLPPLFALTGQQVTMGLTFKAKFPKIH